MNERIAVAPWVWLPPTAARTLPLLRRAAAESSTPLDPAVRLTLERQLGRDFSRVRVHGGTQSRRAADYLNARAYALGRDIHLGSEAHSMSAPDRQRLLLHEAVHAAQQGMSEVAPSGALHIGGDQAAEHQAQGIASALQPPTGDRPASGHGASNVALAGQARLQQVAAQVQRDLSGKFPVAEGEFDMAMTTQSNPVPAGQPPVKNGLKGTIKFKPSDHAPDAKTIRLLQAAKTVDLSTGKDFVWSGGEANRNKVMTVGDKSRGIEGGMFVDQTYAAAAMKPRAHKTDAPVSPYYIDYGNSGAANNHDGGKQGKTVHDASLWDYPGANGNIAFSFETHARDPDSGHVFGTVMWGFEITDARKGKIEKERAVGRNVTLLTTDKAIENFDRFFRNRGASTAPRT